MVIKRTFCFRFVFVIYIKTLTTAVSTIQDGDFGNAVKSPKVHSPPGVSQIKSWKQEIFSNNRYFRGHVHCKQKLITVAQNMIKTKLITVAQNMIKTIYWHDSGLDDLLLKKDWCKVNDDEHVRVIIDFISREFIGFRGGGGKCRSEHHCIIKGSCQELLNRFERYRPTIFRVVKENSNFNPRRGKQRPIPEGFFSS